MNIQSLQLLDFSHQPVVLIFSLFPSLLLLEQLFLQPCRFYGCLVDPLLALVPLMEHLVVKVLVLVLLGLDHGHSSGVFALDLLKELVLLELQRFVLDFKEFNFLLGDFVLVKLLFELPFVLVQLFN